MIVWSKIAEWYKEKKDLVFDDHPTMPSFSIEDVSSPSAKMARKLIKLITTHWIGTVTTIGVVVTIIGTFKPSHTPSPQAPPHSQTQAASAQPKADSIEKLIPNVDVQKLSPPKKIAPEAQTKLKNTLPQQINSTKSNVFSGTNTGSLHQTININEAPPDIKKGAKGFISTYDFNGAKREIAPGRSIVVAGDEFGVFQSIAKLEKEKKYPELASICKSQIKKTPEWLTPYFFLGIAAANMGLKDEAISNFEHVIEDASGNPDYREAEKFMKLLKSSP